jgi:two-component system phosphate regulon sensor histidine kinase PhoR
MTVFRKSLFTLGLAAFGITVVLVVSMLVFMNSLYYEINIMGLRNTAKAFMLTIGEDRIADYFKEDTGENIDIPINDNTAYRLTLVKPSGYVLWDSYVSERLVNHLDREEIVAALHGKEASSRRNSISTNMKLIYYALPVMDGNNIAGVFRLSFSVPKFGTRISSIIVPLVIFSIVMIIAVFFVIYIFSRSLSISIGRLVNITQAGAALLSGSEAEEVAPEFRSLEKAIRAMTAELNVRLDQATSEGRRLEAILNGMSDALFGMDSTLKLHLVNPCARKLFNLGNQDITAMTLLEATRSSELVDFARKALASDSPFEMELTFRTGAEQQFQVFASPLYGVNGRSGVVLVLRDVTRLVKLERIRKDFVANVSHELRTPIQLIKGFSETLQDKISELDKDAVGGDDGKKIIHFIKIIRKNISVMENLTNDLLILADLENNSGNGREKEEERVSSLIDDAVSSVELQAEGKNIEINTDCSDDLKAHLYGSFIIQALINLIDNAIKYSPEKSKVWVSAYLEDNNIVFQVRDRGIGIPAEHQERIFERFYRVDRARSKEQGGTGLGLSIVRHIALLHHGETEVESHAGEGSTFRIRIPQ